MNTCNSNSENQGLQIVNTLECIFSRRSVRKFLNRPVEEEKVQLLLKSGMSAPSGKDSRPWEFIVVDSRTVLDSMAAALPYAKMLKEAPLAIVVCGDPTKSSYWYIDCSAAAENILLAAAAVGLGGVWTATYPYGDRMQTVKECTGMPDHISSLCVIPIGYPAVPQNPKDKWDDSRIHYNRW